MYSMHTLICFFQRTREPSSRRYWLSPTNCSGEVASSRHWAKVQALEGVPFLGRPTSHTEHGEKKERERKDTASTQGRIEGVAKKGVRQPIRMKRTTSWSKTIMILKKLNA